MRPTFKNGFFRKKLDDNWKEVNTFQRSLSKNLKCRIASKYISQSVKFTTVLERPFVLRGKRPFRDVRRSKNNTSNLRINLILS